MSHGAKPVVAALVGLAVLLTAGIAGACPYNKQQATSGSQGTVATSTQSQDQTRGG